MGGDTAPAAPEQCTFLLFLIEPHNFPPVSQRPVTHSFLGLSLVPGNKLAADSGVSTPEPVPQGPAGALSSITTQSFLKIQHPLPPHIHILPTISGKEPLTPRWGLTPRWLLPDFHQSYEADWARELRLSYPGAITNWPTGRRMVPKPHNTLLCQEKPLMTQKAKH